MQTLRPALLSCAFILVGCSSSGEHTDPSLPSAAHSATYRPAAFTEDTRLQRIEEVLPQIESIFQQYAQNNHYVGQAYGVVVDGELIFSDALGVSNIETQTPVDIHTKFHIASLTKSFTSMAILKLRDAGRLSLQDPVGKYIREVRDIEYLTSDAPALKIENLMTMTSGLPEDNPWADRHLEDSEEQLLALIANGVSFSNIPGNAYEYSNLGYALLGTIISRVSGRPYQQYITEEILEPLGMLETYWDYSDVPEDELALGYRWEDEQWKLEPMLHNGAFGSIGGLITSLDDFGKYVGFHLSAWPPRNAPDDGPLRRSSVREMHVPIHPRLNAGAKDADGEPCAYMGGYSYGLGVRVNCLGVTRVSHTGGLPGFGSNVQFFPAQGVGVISFANLTYAASGIPHAEVITTLFAEDRLGRRSLPVSDILKQRAPQVAALLQTWDEALGDEILADNFYLDKSREHRKSAADAILEEAGPITDIDQIVPRNQMRGTFVMHGEKHDVRVFFTLSPEKPGRVQRLDLRLQKDD